MQSIEKKRTKNKTGSQILDPSGSDCMSVNMDQAFKKLDEISEKTKSGPERKLKPKREDVPKIRMFFNIDTTERSDENLNFF